MITQTPSLTWEEAHKSFYLHKRAVRSANTAIWYRKYVKGLMNWAEAQEIPLEKFTNRHIDQYLAFRADAGKAPATIHHDELTACVFFEWCFKNDVIPRDPLKERKVRTAPKSYKYMPTAVEVKKLLQAIQSFYDAEKNAKSAKGHSALNRSFHRDLTYAIELVKLDSACRIGEILNFKLSDYGSTDKGRQLTVRASKGREPRTLPLSKTTTDAIDEWIKMRTRIMKDTPADQDEKWLFISEAGTRLNEGNYLRSLKKIVRWADLPASINNHSQRRFSLNDMAKDENGGLLFAQSMAGHKDPKTTMIYLKIDSDYLREKHEQSSPVKGLMTETIVKKRRLV